jgi:hypothetical protein
MADGRGAGQALDGGAVRKVIADEAEPPLGLEPPAVEGDDAGRLLSAMLQRVQTQGGNRSRVRMTENAKYAAFFAQAVAVKVEIAIPGRGQLSGDGRLASFKAPPTNLGSDGGLVKVWPASRAPPQACSQRVC